MIRISPFSMAWRTAWRTGHFMGIAEVFRQPKSSLWHSGNEGRLLRQVREGNSAAFGELLQLNRPAVEQYLRRRLPADVVEDVLQETFLSAWMHFGRYEADRSLKLWLLGIAQNKIRDHWRKQVGVKESQADWATFEGGAYLQTEFHSVELRESLEKAWRNLEPQLREPLELYYGQSLSLPEIAILLETNLNTVKYRFYRGHTYMAEHLDPRIVESLIEAMPASVGRMNQAKKKGRTGARGWL